MAAAVLDMVTNPHNPNEIWVTDHLFRRHILSDEYNFRVWCGQPLVSISAQWFDSIPVATG